MKNIEALLNRALEAAQHEGWQDKDIAKWVAAWLEHAHEYRPSWAREDRP